MLNRSTLSLIGLSLMLTGLPVRSQTGAAPQRPPNIVLIMMDDMGYADIGSFGARHIRTPHLDRLAREGTRFTSFYVSQAVCTASRASLLTGSYANRVGLQGALNHTSTVGLHADETTLAEMCRSRGYATAIFGKWHLGTKAIFNPLRNGFDEFLGIPYSNDNSSFHPTQRDMPPLPLYDGERVVETDPDQSTFTRRFTERAVTFIERNRDRPFFLYVPHVMPHVPIFASVKFRGKSAAGLYGDVIEELDGSVGTMMAALRKHGLEGNTLVMVLSDNGPFLSYGTHAGSALPLREGKLTTFEGGVRVPFIARWPGHIPSGRASDEPVMTIDLLPTIAELISAPLPERRIDGSSIRRLLLGETKARAPHEALFFYSGDELQAVRSGRWKLHFPHQYLTLDGEPGRDGKPANFGNLKPASIHQSGVAGIATRHGYRVESLDLSLFDLTGDIGEKRNVAAQHPGIVQRLTQLADAMRQELGDALTGTKGRGVRQAGQQLALAQAEQLFLEKIATTLTLKCQTCHGEDGAAGLDLRSRESLLKGGQRNVGLVSGNAEESPLYLALLGRDGFKQMPPGKPLPGDLIATFKQWIDAGAPWLEQRAAAPAPAAKEKWPYEENDVWAFRPVKRHAVPAVKTAQRAQTPVDAFILQRLNHNAIEPAPQADRVTLIRRATFDLHGLPPAPEEVAAFVRDPLPTPKAFERVVEQLLASPRYGERWARHWLDVVRYADTAGGSNDYERPHAWRYRDYVIRSFNSDKPYDQFIVEQIAGDELDPNRTENLIATGFLRMGPWEHTGMSVEAVTRQEWLDDVTHSTVTAFLGLTMGCAKCHDHKFDPIPAKDYYGVQAVFATTYFEERSADFLPGENISRAAAHNAQWQPRLESIERKYDAVALALGKKPRRKGVAQPASNTPVELPPQTELKRTDPKQIENLELERAYMRRVAMLHLAHKRFAPLAFSVVSGGKEKTPAEETFLLTGGNLSARGERVAPAVLSAPAIVQRRLNIANLELPVLPRTIENRRLGLARWIADRDNPLTSRVMVNRIWQTHFGKGLVETSNNFGKLGKRPTHPELLDWLAMHFIESKWSMKQVHRLIMNSAAYQRASQYPETKQHHGNFSAKADPDNRLLARFTPRRIEAEVLRDSLLMVSGELNWEMGGPGGFPELNQDLVAQPRLIMGTVAPAYEASLAKADRNRRTIYCFQQRSLINPLLEVFNGANPNESCEFRRTSTIAPQVFSLFNSRFSADIALAFAKRLETMAEDRARQIELAFQLAFQRTPTRREQQQTLAHLAAMTAHHRAHRPAPFAERLPALAAINSEYSGETFRFTEDQDWSRYEYNLHPSQVSAQTRALAEVCLALINANEFIYVY